MTMNTTFLQGRVPFEPSFKAAEGDKKAFCAFQLFLNTGVKNEETGYYEEFPVKCLCSGGWAENFAKNWNAKTVVDLRAKLVQGKDYTNKDGELVKGGLEFRVTEIHNFNSLDVTIMRAKVPNFENSISFKAAEGDKGAFIRLKLSVSTGVKNEETGFYNERIITAKAFGKTAEFINEYYKAGDCMTIEGKYRDAQDYTDKNGELVKAMPELIINNIYGFPRRKDEEGSTTKSTSKAPAVKGKAPGTKAPGAVKAPGAAKAPGAPGKKLGLGLNKKK